MRLLLCSALVLALAATGLHAQQLGKDSKPLVKVLPLELPAATQVGEEFTLTAPVQNNSNELQVVNLRLSVPDQMQLLAPGAEQIIVLEPNTSQSVKWRLKRVGGQACNFLVEPAVLALGRPANPTPRLNLGAAEAALTKSWQGVWTDKKDNEYQTVLTLQVNADKSFYGRIDWKLVRTKRPDLQPKVGLTGVEFVWGLYDANERTLLLEGYRRDDPHVMLGLDKYLLTLGKDGMTLGGKTWEYGSWDGRLDLTPGGK